MRASTATVNVDPIPEEKYVRERKYCASELCPHCNRGHMHRAHRHSGVDFVVSLIGIFPTVCGYCRVRGQRLEPLRPLLLLGASALVLASFVAYRVSEARAAAAPVKIVHATAHQGDSPASTRPVFDGQ